MFNALNECGPLTGIKVWLVMGNNHGYLLISTLPPGAIDYSKIIN
jgi:hypothetical protein